MNVGRFTRDFGQRVPFFERLAKNDEHFSLVVEQPGDEGKKNVGHTGPEIHEC
jgi:hypothetical protein